MYSFTQEDLLQYLYNETSPEKAAAIKAALILDCSLQEKLEVLSSAYEHLDTVKLMSPRKQTVDAIINYAKNAVTHTADH